MAEVEGPNTFLGAREATTAGRGKGGRSEEGHRVPTLSLTVMFSLQSPTQPLRVESPAIQNSRITLPCSHRFFLLVKGPGHCFRPGWTSLAHRAVGSSSLPLPQPGSPEHPLPSTVVLACLTFSVCAWDTACFSPHHVQTRGMENNWFSSRGYFTRQEPENQNPATVYMGLFPARSATLPGRRSYWFRDIPPQPIASVG